MKYRKLFTLFIIYLCLVSLLSACLPGNATNSNRFISEMVPMRDGAKLATYVYLPEGTGPFPTLVTRTIYGLPIGAIGGYPEMEIANEDMLSQEEAAQIGWPLITDNGYALVVQITRGRFNSEGVDRSWLDDAQDGYDLIEWVDQQPWSNGRIGMFGDSALGVTALQAAGAQPPSLDAIYVQATAGNPIGEDLIPSDGGVKLESLMVQGASLAADTSLSHWAARGLTADEATTILADVGPYLGTLFEGMTDPHNSSEWMALPTAQHAGLSQLMPFWDGVFTDEGQKTYRNDLDVTGKVEVPTYIVSLWQDVFIDSTMDLFTDLQQRQVPSRLLMLNGTHYDIDDPTVWPEPVMLDWFDYWLQDVENGIADGPVVEYAVQGSDDEWRSSPTWPLADTHDRTLFLDADGQLSNDTPHTDAGTTSYIYDPSNPVPTLGGQHLLAPSGLLDQRPLQQRDDVLTYTSEPLVEDTLIGGAVTANLWVTSDAVDTDFVVKLIDVHPDGTANVILDDLIRLKYRDGREQEQLIEPGEMVELHFDLGHTAHRFYTDHSIQINITSSDFPAWDRNLNSGVSSFKSTEYVVATNTIFHNKKHPSRITLPVINE